MNSSPILISVILTFISAATATLPTSGTESVLEPALIEESCTQIAQFDIDVPKQYCVSALQAVSKKPTVNQRELASASLDLLIKSVSSTKGKIELLAHGPQGQSNPKLRNILQHCNSMYNEANRRTKEAVSFIEKGQFGSADRTIAMIQAHGSECEDMFEEEDLPSPFSKENKDCDYLSGMTCLLIRFFDKSYTPDGRPVLKNP